MFVCCVHAFDRGIESDLMMMDLMQFSYSDFGIEVIVMPISMRPKRLSCTAYQND
jgi:hypothetical protein